MSSESYKWGWLNVSGVRGSLEEVVQFMDEQEFSFLILGETWLKPMDILRHPSIVFDLRYPSRDPSKGRGIHGLMVVRNPNLAEACDFEEVKRDQEHHSYIWFRFRGMVFGGFYLPPSMELTVCIECVLSAEDIVARLGDGEPVFLVGDLNMRLGHITGDLTTNFRSNIMSTLRDLGLSWVRPDFGKWTVHTSRGRSIVDYVFANQNAGKLTTGSKVWEDDYIGGSDHRLVSCNTKTWRASTSAVNIGSGGSRYPNGRLTIRKGDLMNPQLRSAAAREFKAGRKHAKDEVLTQLGPLLYPEYVSTHIEAQRRMDSANGVLMKYIDSSLARGGITPKPVQCAKSGPFWDDSLTLVKKERNRLLKAAKWHPIGSAEAIFLEDKAKEAHRRLRKEVRRRKREGFLAFTEAVASKPVAEAKKWMSSIRRRLQDPNREPGPGLSVDRLDTYAEHFAKVFSSETWKAPEHGQRITATKDLGLTHGDLSEAVESLPNNKAPGSDGITAEVLKLGGQALLSVMYPLYKAVRAWGVVPSNWNTAVLHMIWKGKGRRDEIDKYRPIALTSIFRKVLEKTMIAQLQEYEDRLDVAQGGFIKGKSTYDLILALDMIVKEQCRKKRDCWQAFLDIKGAYDTVNRDILWKRCNGIGIKGGLLVLLKCLFDYAETTIRIGGQASRKVPMGRGLLQGSLLSPMLFNIFIDTLPRTLRRKHSSFLLGSHRINSLLYADDIVLVARTQEQLQSMLVTCEQHSISHGYVFSPSKCEIIAPKGKEPPYARLYGEMVRQTLSFKYLGIPFNDQGVDVTGLVVEGISRAVKTANLFSTVGCNGSGFRPTVSKWILTTFVRPQMEYGLGLTYIGKGLEKALNKAWSRICRRALTLPPTTSGPAILKMMRMPDMGFRARKLNSMRAARTHRADANGLLGSIYRYAIDGAGRRTKKSLLVRSRRNPMTRDNLGGAYDYRSEERRHIKELGIQPAHIVASRISIECPKADAFLKYFPRSRGMREVLRKLVLWRTGVIPGKPQECKGCSTGVLATRDHVIECTRMTSTFEEYTQGTATAQENTLDAVLNQPLIWKHASVWNKIRTGMQAIWTKCLGRVWGTPRGQGP